MDWGAWADPRRGRTRFGDWAEQVMATRPDLRPSTIARDDIVMRRLVLPTFSSRALGSIKASDLRSWVTDMAGEGYSSSYRAKAWHMLRLVLARAVEEGIIPRSPAAVVAGPTVGRSAEERSLSPADVESLADAIHPRYRGMVYAGAYGGLRRGETAALRVSSVDFLRRILQVDATLAEIGGKPMVGPPKTASSRRQVPLNDTLAGELRRHLDFFSPSPEGYQIQ